MAVLCTQEAVGVTMGASRGRGWWDAWLTLVAVCVAAAGFLLAAFPASGPVDALVNRYVDPAFWPNAPVPPEAAAYRAWVFGVTGSVMGGWGLLMVAVLRGPFRRREPWAWPALAVPLICWYLTDTTVSVLRGAMANAVLNTALLLLFAVPLAATVRAFFHPGPRRVSR